MVLTGEYQMKLKTLLLGSAAAMIAVSGARAADAVVAEPEPVEYVRVCDMYGSGFFYIPGTETCLSINGYARVGYYYIDNGGVAGPEQGRFEYRARLNFDARNETDYGTLRSQIRIQGDGREGDANAVIDRALISLGGFRIGYSDSFQTTFHGYGNYIERRDGLYGFDQAIFLDYTYSANGFSVGVGVQDTDGVGGAVNRNIDPYIGVGYTGSSFSVAASYLHDTQVDEGQWKVSATVTPVEGLDLKAWYRDQTGVNRYAGGTNNAFWGVSARYAFTEDVTLGLGYTDSDAVQSAQYAATLFWQVAPGLSFRPEVVIFENARDWEVGARIYRTF